ncbi:unnamed protein product [Urochloa humidicola]
MELDSIECVSYSDGMEDDDDAAAVTSAQLPRPFLKSASSVGSAAVAAARSSSPTALGARRGLAVVAPSGFSNAPRPRIRWRWTALSAARRPCRMTPMSKQRIFFFCRNGLKSQFLGLGGGVVAMSTGGFGWPSYGDEYKWVWRWGDVV